VKYYHLAVWTLGRMKQPKPPETTLFMTSLTKKPETHNQKNFFHCRREDLQNLLRGWTAL